MRTDRTGIVAAAAAQELNDDLTVILNSVAESLRALEAGHPSRAYLLDLRAAAQRCVRKATGLLNFCARSNRLPVRASFESLTRL
jgi:predicted TIM-barrel fold metal-dependent hydrolase